MGSAFIDCMVCRARLISHAAGSDAQFIAWAAGKGWTVGPTRCPEHAGEAGALRTWAGWLSLGQCALDHDPEPWLEYVGLAMAQTVFSGGGPSSGRVTLRPRSEFCRTLAHYWLYDRFTIPELEGAA